jgi:DNA-binding NarL/FixJ family response regulator
MLKLNLQLVEDTILIFKGVIKRLVYKGDFEFKIQSRDGKELLNQLTASNSPQFLTMEIEISENDKNNNSHLDELRHPKLKILMLSIYDDADLKTTEGTFEGVKDFVLNLYREEIFAKSSTFISSPMEWENSASFPIVGKPLNGLRQFPNTTMNKPVDISYLTSREKDVLALLTEGINVGQIGDKLFISPKTVRKHLEHIYDKLQVSGSKGAILKMFTGQ